MMNLSHWSLKVGSFSYYLSVFNNFSLKDFQFTMSKRQISFHLDIESYSQKSL